MEQIEHAKKGSVAVLYASAYGNTAGMAQAISRGITKAGIAVETLNLEVDSIDDALDAVKRAKGFIIGSPTLGGHLPTQVRSLGHRPPTFTLSSLLWMLFQLPLVTQPAYMWAEGVCPLLAVHLASLRIWHSRFINSWNRARAVLIQAICTWTRQKRLMSQVQAHCSLSICQRMWPQIGCQSQF